MKVIARAACLAVLLAPGLAAAADYGCEYVNFGEEVLKQFPRVLEACQGVTTRNDQPYAKFSAEVVSANKEQAVVDFLDKKDKPMGRITFAVKNPDNTVQVNGKPVKVSKLEKGTRVNFYMLHNKWGLYATPSGEALTILSREEPK
jgi:hypothetical protein